MAMGRRGPRQGELLVAWDELPRSPGHAFYDRLQAVLVEAGFDRLVEALCKPYGAEVMGAPSLPSGRCFRMHLVGYLEGIDSERGLEWQGADSLSLRAFLGLGRRGRVVPDQPDPGAAAAGGARGGEGRSHRHRRLDHGSPCGDALDPPARHG